MKRSRVYHPIIPPFEVISVTNIDQLIPEYLKESEHFFLVYLDVEGNVKDANTLFRKTVNFQEDMSILSNINKDSANRFEQLLDEILHQPKKVHQVLLELNSQKGNVQTSSWEFTMLINQEMDPIGFIGIGVGLKMLENKLPWNQLIDVLSLGKADLDENLCFRSVDIQILNWLNTYEQDLLSKNILDLGLIEFNLIDQLKLKCTNGIKDFYQFRVNLPIASKNTPFSISLFRHSNGFLLLMRELDQIVTKEIFSKPFTDFQIEAFAGPVWILDRDTTIVQQNSFAKGVSEKWLKKLSKEGEYFDLKFANEKSDRVLELISGAFEGKEKDFNLQIKQRSSEPEFWKFQIKPINVTLEKSLVMVYAIDQTSIHTKMARLESEIETLRELARTPSHILRSPLSSMLGLLELIDFQKLDPENERYISYLKPLAQELDEVIRSNAKKMAALD